MSVTIVGTSPKGTKGRGLWVTVSDSRRPDFDIDFLEAEWVDGDLVPVASSYQARWDEIHDSLVLEEDLLAEAKRKIKNNKQQVLTVISNYWNNPKFESILVSLYRLYQETR